jgi:membrane protease YdiL (CAAX protease family)
MNELEKDKNKQEPEVYDVEIIEPKQDPKEVAEVKEKGPEKQFPSWQDLLSTVGVFGLSVVVASFFVASMMKTRGVATPTPDMTFIYYIIQMLPTLVFVMWLRHRAGRENAVHWGHRDVNFPTLLWGFVLIAASGIVLEPVLSLFPTEGYDNVTNTIGTGGWAILSTVIAAPVLEEMLFRGLIFETCRERFGNMWAVLISALLFGLIHIVPVQMVNAFVVGVILGYIYLKTRSLLSVIILHATNNVIAYLNITLFGESADVTVQSLFTSKIAYWILYAIALGIFVYSFVNLWKTLHTDSKNS